MKWIEGESVWARYKSSDNVTKTFCSVGDYPRIVSGKNACPPEDCGGPWGYGNLLKVLAGRNSAQKRELLEWLGEAPNYQRRLSIRMIRKLNAGLGIPSEMLYYFCYAL